MMTNKSSRKDKRQKIREEEEEEDNSIKTKKEGRKALKGHERDEKSLVLMLIRGSREVLGVLITLCLFLLVPVICLLAPLN